MFFNQSNNHMTDTTCMGVLVGANMLTIVIIILGSLTIMSIFICFVIQAVLVFPYMSRKKQAKVLWKYKNESEKARIRGNIIITLYIILSFVLVYLVAIYHITIQNIL
jgi:hypothetical protein